MQIVYATDHSPGAVAAAEFLSRMSLKPDDRIVLVHVAHRGHGEDHEEAFRSELQLLDGSPARRETQTRSGAAPAEILEAAREISADLIVVGAIGGTGLSRFFIGSVAEKVLRHAETTVLVARPVRYGMQRALVAVDNSDMAKSVAAYSVLIPLPPATELRLTTVLPPPEAVVAAAPTVWASLADELDSALHSAVQGTEERLRDLALVMQEGGHPISAQVLRGEPERTLVHAADTEQADLLLLGSYGEGGLDRFLLGSVSERVCRHAHCSVMVVR